MSDECRAAWMSWASKLPGLRNEAVGGWWAFVTTARGFADRTSEDGFFESDYEL